MVVGLAVMWCLVSLSESSEGVEVQPNGQQTRASTDGSEVNIARSRTAVAFAHSKKFGPENAVDGNMQTRYAGLSTEPFSGYYLFSAKYSDVCIWGFNIFVHV